MCIKRGCTDEPGIVSTVCCELDADDMSDIIGWVSKCMASFIAVQISKQVDYIAWKADQNQNLLDNGVCFFLFLNGFMMKFVVSCFWFSIDWNLNLLLVVVFTFKCRDFHYDDSCDCNVFSSLVSFCLQGWSYRSVCVRCFKVWQWSKSDRFSWTSGFLSTLYLHTYLLIREVLCGVQFGERGIPV